MVAAEVTELLVQWEGRLRDLGAPCTQYLRPGLTAKQVAALADKYEVRLGDDATAVWVWRDGDRAGYEDDWGRPSCTPSGLFLSLSAALERSARLRRITDAVRHGLAADLAHSNHDPWPGELSGTEVYFRAGYVILAEDENPVFIDCAETSVMAMTGIFLTHDTYRTSRVSLADRIRYRIDAIDRGLWRLDEQGRWQVHDDHAPDIPRWWDYYA